ncbi:MAG TPA: hypothetical protein VHV83_19570, partial [Armatimonadota bacterium]|nr:hypothetical protein [Armatimonadota bacterium]
EIKAVDPKMQVLTAGFATLRWGAHPDLVDYVTQHGTQDFDILAMHVHGNFQHYRKTVDGPLAEVRSAMKPPKPLFFNETAMTVYNGDGEQGQAETLVKKVVYARACGAMGYQWYDLRNDGFDPMNGEHNYGLITHDFYPKAVYAAFNTLALHIRDKHYLAALPVGAGRNAYVFDDADEQIVVTWNDEVNASDGNMILATDAAQAYRMDLMGNTTPTPITNGRVVLPITAQPMYLVLAKAKRTPTVQGALAVVTGLRPSAPGDSRHVTVTLVNPFNKPDTAEVTWMLPNELHTAPVIQQVNLAANGKAATSLEMVIPANLTVKAGDTLYMRMKYVFKQTGWTGTIVAPVPMAVYVPTTPQPHDADFILESRQHVVNLFENNPATAQLTWQGTQDLSARVWLGHTAQAMTMHIVVHDDTFVPSPDTKSIFRGDSVQLQLRIPGQVGYWDAGFARLADGTPGVLIVRPPKGMADPTTQIKVSTSAQEKTIVYDIELPYAAFGLSDAILETGIQFNLLIYDNDGKEREGWLQISPGSIEVPELSPFVVYAPK